MTVMERKIETEIILSPLAAKELANWLANTSRIMRNISVRSRDLELQLTKPFKPANLQLFRDICEGL